MGKIVTIGAGAMGTAFAYPCSDNKHDVSIVGSHLQNNAIDELNKNNREGKKKNVIMPSQPGNPRCPVFSF